MAFNLLIWEVTVERPGWRRRERTRAANLSDAIENALSDMALIHSTDAYVVTASPPIKPASVLVNELDRERWMDECVDWEVED